MKITNDIAAVGVLALLPLLTIGQEKPAVDTKEGTATPSQSATSDSEPQTAEEAYRRGARLVQSRHVDDAISMFGKAILLKPDWALAFAARGQASSQVHRYTEAIKDFDEAIRLDSGHAGWYDLRGLAYSSSGQHSRAIEDYDRAIELSPNTSGYYNNRGWSYTELGQFEKAIADLSKALQLAPDNVRAYENRGTAYARMQDWPHAIADYTAAIQISPTGWQYQRRAEAKLSAGDQAGAEEDRAKGATQQASMPVPASPGAYRIGSGVTPPGISFKVEPNYSDEARKARLEGKVALFVVVNPDGKPRDLRILRSLGLGLDERAIEAVSQWQFLPGTKDGRPVPVQATIEVNFRLLDKPAPASLWHLGSISFKPPVGASRPQLLSARYPRPSDSAASASLTLSFDVDEHGVPTNLQIENSSDQQRENKLLEAVRDWRFNPGVKDGKAVVVPCTLSFALGATAPK